MTLAKGFVVIILSGFVFALGGGLIGYLLAVLLPGYYRATCASGRAPWFNPVEVGIGLGFSQGLICGLILGAVVVLAVAWSNSRRNAPDLSLGPDRHPGLRLASHADPDRTAFVSGEQLQDEARARFGK